MHSSSFSHMKNSIFSTTRSHALPGAQQYLQIHLWLFGLHIRNAGNAAVRWTTQDVDREEPPRDGCFKKQRGLIQIDSHCHLEQSVVLNLFVSFRYTSVQTHHPIDPTLVPNAEVQWIPFVLMISNLLQRRSRLSESPPDRILHVAWPTSQRCGSQILTKQRRGKFWRRNMYHPSSKSFHFVPVAMH